ncbi:MAG: transposase [Syntrophomonadaceae bacterium]|jgi:putative transposase
MPRTQRVRGEFSTYHVVQRGNERKNIFRNHNDKTRFLEILARAKEKYNFLVYAYCLMDNHVHLVIADNGNDISKLIKSINVSYVIYFNRIYQRCGHLFQDRFKSELIDNDSYLLEVSRYIHNNPVKAHIVEKPGDFQWSSYNIYLGKAVDNLNLLDTNKVLGWFSDNKRQAIREYEKFVTQNVEVEPTILDINEEYLQIGQENHDYINDISTARIKLEKIMSEEQITMEELLKNKPRRNEIIRMFRKNSSFSLKEIGELFGGLSAPQVSRIVRG